jgi:hypothetical protein
MVEEIFHKRNLSPVARTEEKFYLQQKLIYLDYLSILRFGTFVGR